MTRKSPPRSALSTSAPTHDSLRRLAQLFGQQAARRAFAEQVDNNHLP